MITRRSLLTSSLALLAATAKGYAKPIAPWAQKLVEAARAQVGVTKSYDPAYRKIAFPGGDVPRETGVCTDVVIRAYRDAFGVDLQALVNKDMKSNFVAYPKNWGLKRTDSNIDHRRVPNLQTFLKRKGAALTITDRYDEFAPGDIVTFKLPNGAPHIGLVSDQKTLISQTPLLIHNIGWGTREDNMLSLFTITGHYRFDGE